MKSTRNCFVIDTLRFKWHCHGGVARADISTPIFHRCVCVPIHISIDTPVYVKPAARGMPDFKYTRLSAGGGASASALSFSSLCPARVELVADGTCPFLIYSPEFSFV